ncbi:MAG: DUF6056 family protein [Gammaproteobacteria bacterium]|nr:DUF6056 family protein [Gammaproteobacteria bacterium]
MNSVNKLLPILLLGIISFIVILIFVSLGFYAYPAADDFCMASGVQREGLLTHLWNHYFEWSGRYAGNALYAGYPLLFGLFTGNQIMPLLLLGLLFLSSAYFLASLFAINIRSLPVVILALGFVSVFLLGIRHSASSLYWISGAMTYQSANILLLLTLGLMIRIHDRQQQQQDSKALWVGLGLAVVVGMGSNENNMITLLGVLLLALLINRQRTWQQQLPWLTLLVIALVCFSIVYLSPGNTIRESTFPQRHDLIHAISGSLRMGSWTLMAWILNPLFILASLLLLVGVPWIHQHSSRNYQPGRGVVLLLFLLTLGMPFVLQFPAWWSMGGWPPPRTVDAIFFVFVLNWSLLLGAVSLRYAPHQRLPALVKSHQSSLLILLTLLVIGAVLINSKFQRALDDLTGPAITFQQYMQDRHQRIDNAVQNQQEFLLVPVYRQEYPRSIFFNDIRSDYRDWRNKCYAEFFGLKAIQREPLPK